MLFELLCGHPPFVGDSPVSVAYQHVREQPPTPSTINPDVNPAVDAIVLKALSKNPLNRYQSAGEMRADLLRAAAGRPVLATPVMPADETMPMGAAAGGGYHQAQQTQMMGPQTRQQPVARVGDPGKRKSSSWVIAAFAALGVLAVIALGTALWLNQAGNEKVSVPQVVGRSQAEAQAALTQAGLRFTAGDPVQNTTCERGSVVDQSPSFGQRVEKNTEVTVNVCTGPGQVNIPTNLTGGTYDAARDRLTELKLVPVRENVNGSAPEGQVVDVSPKEGSAVAEGSKVTLKVSRGNVSEVPNVRGYTEDQAKQRLKEAGYVVRVQEGDEVDPAEAGKVSSQSPAAGTSLAKGERVTIRVDVPREEETTSPTPSGTPSATPTTPGGGGNGGGSGFPFPPVAPTRTGR